MPDYKNGQIYRLWSPHTDKFYIGSTCNMLAKRFHEHFHGYKKFLKSNTNYTSSYKLFELGMNDVEIELIELCPCNSRAELNRREGELIRLHKDNIVNLFDAGRTRQEYEDANRDYIYNKFKKYKHEWYIAQKEKKSQPLSNGSVSLE